MASMFRSYSLWTSCPKTRSAQSLLYSIPTLTVRLCMAYGQGSGSRNWIARLSLPFSESPSFLDDSSMLTRGRYIAKTVALLRSSTYKTL